MSITYIIYFFFFSSIWPEDTSWSLEFHLTENPFIVIIALFQTSL